MKLEQVMLQLFKKIPIYTEFFSTNISVSLLSLTGTTVTATCATPHGLITGNTVNISGAIIRNPIVTLTRTNNTAFAETQFDNDLTEVFNPTVQIQGANQIAYNGTHTLLNVLNRRQFTFTVTGDPITPATGTIFLNEVGRSVNPYNGIKIVTSTPSTTTFTYEISSTLFSPPTGTIIASKGLRVGGAISLDKAAEWYSRQNTNDYWMFVVLNDNTASKDRFNKDDATGTTSRGTRYRQRVITPLTIFVFAPLRDDISQEGVSGRALRDSMEDVFYALCKSVLRVKFPNTFEELEWSELMFVNHGFYGYNQAYYIHQFSFESTYDITFDDTVDPDDNVAFRDIEVDFQRIEDDYILATLQANLDDQPL